MSLERLRAGGHEEVSILQDATCGLQGVVAIHDTRLGPALMATRLRPRASLDEALDEALRLAQAVTFETALAGAPRGGGAAVFVGDAAAEKSRTLLVGFARVLDRLDGRAQAIADIGFGGRDLTVLARMTRHVAGRRGAGRDAAELTALGVLECLRVTAVRLGLALDRMHVAIQGIGQVGYRLAALLAAEGTRLTVADVNEGSAERVRAERGAEIVPAEAIAAVVADVFSPNAGSGLLDEVAVARLRCRAVVGAARAVLSETATGERLHERGVLYAPDALVAAGGLAAAVGDDDEMAIQERVAELGPRLDDLWTRAQADGISPQRAAERVLQTRIGPRTPTDVRGERTT